MPKILIYLFLAGLALLPITASAEIANHVVISQIQTDSTAGAGGASDDFIELYNPTNAEIDLNGYRLVKRTASGITDQSIKSWTTSTVIPAHGFYLWVNSGFGAIGITPNAATISTIADDNGIALRQGPMDVGQIIDAVAWGNAQNAFVETSAVVNPTAGQALLRKSEMIHQSGQGNGWDTNNNANDFIIADPRPRNTQSPPENIPPPPPPPEPEPEPAPEPPKPSFSQIITSRIHSRLEALFNKIFPH